MEPETARRGRSDHQETRIRANMSVKNRPPQRVRWQFWGQTPVKFGFVWMALLLLVAPLAAQDALNLPSALYVLTNAGQVSRYGLGTEGVRPVTPEGTFVIDFGVAPDDTWLAYRTDQGLTLYQPYSQTQIALDSAQASIPSVRGRGDTIAWAPAGDALAITTLTGGRVYLNTESDPQAAEAFHRLDLTEAPFVQVMWSPDGRYLAGESEGGSWWLYRRAGHQMILTSAIPFSDGLAWYNATTLAFAPQEGGLRLMDLNAANRQTVLLDDTWVYRQPQLLPDGTLAVFGRQKNDPAVPEGFARLIGLPPGEARIDNLSDRALALTGLRWTVDGGALVALEGGRMALINPVDANRFDLPINDAAAYAWGPPLLPRVQTLPPTSPAYFLAPDAEGIVQVWRLPGDGAAPAPVTAQTEPVSAFAVSPDNTRLAVVSGARLLTQALDADAEPAQIAELSAAAAAAPAFSPDGQQIAYTDGGIWLTPVSGGEPQLILADETAAGFERRFSAPQFAPNINALLVQVERPNIVVPGVLDLTTGEVLEIALAQSARWLQDGRIVLYGAGRGGRAGGLALAGTDSLDQPAQLLPDFLPVQTVREISPGRLLLALPERLTGPVMLRVAALEVINAQLTPVQTGGFMVDPALAPDGAYAAGYVYRDSSGFGPLTLRNLRTGEQVILAAPAVVSNFVWTNG
jgi:Tol biopolymer transport system component